LSEGGLRPALCTLARRAAIPVELDIRTRSRPADPIEVAAYYVVSEALTNTTKHASASHAHVAVEERDARLHLSTRDDGAGGADPLGGSGLMGLRDRVKALGGSIEVNSRPGGRHRDPRRASAAARLTGRPTLLPRHEWQTRETLCMQAKRRAAAHRGESGQEPSMTLRRCRAQSLPPRGTVGLP
jgi:hypothetical protein